MHNTEIFSLKFFFFFYKSDMTGDMIRPSPCNFPHVKGLNLFRLFLQNGFVYPAKLILHGVQECKLKALDTAGIS